MMEVSSVPDGLVGTCPYCQSSNVHGHGYTPDLRKRMRCWSCDRRFTPNRRANKGNTTHGHATGGKVSPTYSTWQAMMNRCHDPKFEAYIHYGAKGISVTPRWHTFAKFLEDMGERPKGHTIDRRDGTKGYSKENCRWATAGEQAINRRSTHFIEYDGLRLPISQWDVRNGFYPGTIYQRLRRGWSVGDALTTPRLEDHR